MICKIDISGVGCLPLARLVSFFLGIFVTLVSPVTVDDGLSLYMTALPSRMTALVISLVRRLGILCHSFREMVVKIEKIENIELLLADG